jgi:hypothetical protein
LNLLSRYAMFALGVALLGSACATTVINSHSLNPAPHPLKAREAAAVEVFTTGPPTRPFVEVALIEARQAGFDEAPVFGELRSRAGVIGCEGLVLLGSNDSVVGSIVSTLPSAEGSFISGYTETLHGYRATCIVWKDDAAAPARENPAEHER